MSPRSTTRRVLGVAVSLSALVLAGLSLGAPGAAGDPDPGDRGVDGTRAGGPSRW